MNSWLYFSKTFGILWEGNPDGGGGGENHPSRFNEPRPLWLFHLRIMSDVTEKSYEHLDCPLTAGVLNLWPDLYLSLGF